MHELCTIKLNFKWFVILQKFTTANALLLLGVHRKFGTLNAAIVS